MGIKYLRGDERHAELMTSAYDTRWLRGSPPVYVAQYSQPPEWPMRVDRARCYRPFETVQAARPEEAVAWRSGKFRVEQLSEAAFAVGSESNDPGCLLALRPTVIAHPR